MSKKKRSKKISTLGSQAASVLSVSLVLLILGLLMTLGVATRGVRASVLSDVSVIVRMDITATDDDCEKLANMLIGSPYASNAQFLSADAVLEQEMEQNADILELLGENPFSSEFVVKLRPEYANADSIQAIVDQVEAAGSGIDEVISPIDVVATVDNAMRKVAWLLTGVAALLLIISIVLIYNTVSIAVYSRRFLIRTMQLVGATANFIRGPFVKAGLISGILAAAISSILLFLSIYYVKTSQQQLSLDISWGGIAAISGCLFAIGMAICAISAFFATNKYLGAAYDDLYA